MQQLVLITSVKTLAERTLAVRLERGLSQKALAKLAGVAQGTIGNIETGDRMNPRALLNIAKALGVDPDWLLNGTGKSLRANTVPAVAGVDRPMSEDSFQTVSSLTWGELMSEDQKGTLKNEFYAFAPDDAMAPRARVGSRWLFLRDVTPRFGDGVIVKDGYGELHLREYVQGRSPGSWQAAALNSAYRSFESEADQLTVLAVLRIPMQGWADL